MDLKAELVKLIKKTIKEIYSNDELDSLIMVEIPKETIHGDFSTNIAMRLTKVLRKNPQVLANEIKTKLEKQL